MNLISSFYDIAEHVAGGRKAVQQEDHWLALRPGLAVENADTVDIHLLLRDHAHEKSSPLFDRTLPGRVSSPKYYFRNWSVDQMQ